MKLTPQNISMSTLTLIASLSLGGVAGCSKSSEDKAAAQVENLEEELFDAKKEYAQSLEKSQAEFNHYKESMAATFKDNESKITALKDGLKEDRKELQEKYSKELKELQVKNTDLREKMSAFEEDSTTTWEDFKISFNQQMEDMGKAIERITNRNSKDK